MSLTPVIELRDEWFLRRDHGNVGLAEDWPNESFVPEHWRPTTLPGAWQRESDFGPDYHYLGWLRRRVRIPDDWSWKRTLLRFEAVATDLTAWVNGKEVGRHIGDYAPFEFDVSEYVKPGAEIDITVRVDELLGHITKGFHDMLSLHHGGVWRPVTLVGSGRLRVRPNGVVVRGDANTGDVLVQVELDRPAERGGELRVRMTHGDAGEVVASAQSRIERDAASVELRLRVANPRRWSPAEPSLYRAAVELRDGAGLSDARQIRFGFRSIRTQDRHILLNDQPIHLRGVLHWGHEPKTIAPAPSQEQVRREFKQLKARGFNCVCLCMWYAPRYYYEIADEMGMLLWQEHPVWHSPMTDEYLPEYRRLFAEFMRRDRNHPSVIIVSGSCEHPCFHPELADWWWKTAHEMLPDKLLQVQTAFFAWQNPEQTDLHDEHTYDNNDRWPAYLQDVETKLDELPTKPFVMGESVVFSSWPDVPALVEKLGERRPWWAPKILDDAIRLEKEWTDRYGAETVERFRRQSDRHHLLGRKFQIEQFRMHPGFAGLVMNHLRDVAQGTFGFKDDLERWRFTSKQMKPWLCDAPLILNTPGHRRSFASDESTSFNVAISNFSDQDIETEVNFVVVDAHESTSSATKIRCKRGEVGAGSISLTLPRVERVTRITATSSAEGMTPNAWDLWITPPPTPWPSGVYRMSGLAFTPEEREPDPIERGYSHGFGLPATSWITRMPDVDELAPEARVWPHDEPIPDDAKVVITHRLTTRIVDFLEAGGRVLLFANKARGGLGSSYEWLFGQCPLVIERGPLTMGDSEWVVDLLHHDLTRQYARIIPTDRLGIADQIEPIVRLVYVHDQARPRFLDMLFSARVGAGVLGVSSFDHRDPIGRHFLARIVRWLAEIAEPDASELDASTLRQCTVEHPTATTP